MKISSVFNKFIEASSLLDALALFFARLLSGSQFRCLTNGRTLLCGRSLLGALSAFGLGGLDAAEKEDMRALAIRGGPYTPEEQRALLEYCESDVVALARLLP